MGTFASDTSGRTAADWGKALLITVERCVSLIWESHCSCRPTWEQIHLPF